jgi:glutamate dehydrogenase
MERLPEPYQRALFSSWVSSHFVSHVLRANVALTRTLTPRGLTRRQIYKYGVQASSVDFFHFARDLAR